MILFGSRLTHEMFMNLKFDVEKFFYNSKTTLITLNVKLRHLTVIVGAHWHIDNDNI